jgi:hypothetical protein
MVKAADFVFRIKCSAHRDSTTIRELLSFLFILPEKPSQIESHIVGNVVTQV